MVKMDERKWGFGSFVMSMKMGCEPGYILERRTTKRCEKNSVPVDSFHRGSATLVASSVIVIGVSPKRLRYCDKSENRFPAISASDSNVASHS